MIFEIYDKFDFSHSYLKSSILVPQLFKRDFSKKKKKYLKGNNLVFPLIFHPFFAYVANDMMNRLISVLQLAAVTKNDVIIYHSPWFCTKATWKKKKYCNAIE